MTGRFGARRAAALGGLLALAVASCAFAGCATADDWSTPRDAPSAVGTLAPGFTDPAAPPTPEGTVTPEPGSWSGVRPGPGYRVALLTSGDDEAATTLARAVTAWAEQTGVSLKTVTVTDPAKAIDGIVEAMTLGPDLIVSAGEELVDPLAVVSANHLDRQFLILGAQLPEPTGNVTAAVWHGAQSRGSEVPSTGGDYDPAAFTPQRADTAVRAGVASVLSGLTGIVVWLE